MAGRRPEETVRFPASLQRWRAMTFLHWPCDADRLASLLPAGLEPDTWDGAAWISLTPFLMADFRFLGLPPVRRLSTFPETNLRTYVRGPDGRDGLWFLSLDADSLPTVLAASTVYGVPYRWAAMSVEETETIRYRSRRRLGKAAGHDIRIRVEGRCDEPSELDHWLTGRWRAWTTIAGRLATAPVEHQPWPLWEASLVQLDESLSSAVGLPAPDRPPLVQYSPGVDVRLGSPRPS